MKKFVFFTVLIFLLLTPVYQAAAQNSSTVAFDTTGFPQWVKDLRRWEIVAFGTFPFSLFFVTFTMDMIRWNNANGMDFSEQGRRYAPWPLKSAGAFEMSNSDFRRSIFVAAGVSMTAALVDLIIVIVKRNNERRRIDSLPAGSVTIERTPPEVEDPGGTDDEEE
jgi:hypothetical protein